MSAPWIDYELNNRACVESKVEDRKKKASNNLRRLREEIGVNQDTFARVMGVSRAAVSYYENGSRTPDIDFINTVHLKTSADLSYLLGIGSVMRPQFTTLELALDIDERQAENLIDLCAHKAFKTLFNSDRFRHVLCMIEDGAADFVNGKYDYNWTMFQCLKIMENILHEMYDEHVAKLLSDPESKKRFEEMQQEKEREMKVSFDRHRFEIEKLIVQSREKMEKEREKNADNPFALFRDKMECLEHGEEE